MSWPRGRGGKIGRLGRSFEVVAFPRLAGAEHWILRALLGLFWGLRACWMHGLIGYWMSITIRGDRLRTHAVFLTIIGWFKYKTSIAVFINFAGFAVLLHKGIEDSLMLESWLNVLRFEI